jgi:DNA-binding transcriptional LysR family regulator
MGNALAVELGLIANGTMFDWNDLRAFLAVARGGSSLAAAKTLGVNQTTVARRLEALEHDLGVKLLERGQTGSRLTEAGRDLLIEAEKVERAADNFASRSQAHARGLTGRIRITSIELLATLTLTPAIGAYRKQHPEVQIDLLITDQPLDIEAGEADLAIRAGKTLPASNLVARKLAEYPFALYASRDYAERKGLPASPADLADHDLLGGDAGLEMLPGLIWMFEQAGGRPAVSRSNSLTNLVHGVRAGLGIAPLPCVIADVDADLVPCSEPIGAAHASSWIVTRRDLKDTPRIRSFIDFLVPFTQHDMKQRTEAGRKFRETLAANDADGVPAISRPA